MNNRGQYRRIAAANNEGVFRLMVVTKAGSTSRTLRSWRKAYQGYREGIALEGALYVCVVDVGDEDPVYHRVREERHWCTIDA